MTRAQFKDLFDNHFDSVRNYIYYRSGDAEVATDIAQETFLRIWEKQPSSDQNNITGISPEDQMMFEELKDRNAGDKI